MYAPSSTARATNNLSKGVSSKGIRFISRICINGQQFCLGTYDTPEEARERYQKAFEAKPKGEVDEEWIKQHTTKRATVKFLPKGAYKDKTRYKNKNNKTTTTHMHTQIKHEKQSEQIHKKRQKTTKKAKNHLFGR